MKRASLLTVARIIASLSQAVNLILLARGVTPAEFGVTSAFVGLCIFVIVVLDLGTGTLVLRYGRTAARSGGAEAAIMRSAYATMWLLAVVAAVVAPVAGWLVLPGLPLVLLACGGVWVFSERIFETLFCGYLAEERMLRANVVLVTRRVAALATQLGLLAVGFTGTAAFAVSLVVGTAVGAISLIGPRLTYLGERSRLFAYPVRESIRFWIASVSSQSRDLETPVVLQVAGLEQAGWHSVGYRLQRPISLLAMSLAQVVLPSVSAERSTAAREVRTVWSATAISLVLTAVCLPLAPLAIDVLLGASYAPAVPVAQAAVLLAVPFAFAAPLGAVLQGLGGAREVARLGVTLAVLGVGATALGSVLGGALGAVLAAGVVYLVKYAWLSVRLARRVGDVAARAVST